MSFRGEKLNTISKPENRSQWHREQPKMEPHQFKNSSIPNNPWKHFDKYNESTFLKQSFPGIDLGSFGNLTKRERNSIIYQQKSNIATQYFNGKY